MTGNRIAFIRIENGDKATECVQRGEVGDELGIAELGSFIGLAVRSHLRGQAIEACANALADATEVEFDDLRRDHHPDDGVIDAVKDLQRSLGVYFRAVRINRDRKRA